jgi:hypothetical protein
LPDRAEKKAKSSGEIRKRESSCCRTKDLVVLLEFVAANATIETSELYSNVIRAQLSAGETLLLFYTGLSELGNNKFKSLIEVYGLLEGLNKKAVADPAHLKLYESKAYGPS